MMHARHVMATDGSGVGTMPYMAQLCPRIGCARTSNVAATRLPRLALSHRRLGGKAIAQHALHHARWTGRRDARRDAVSPAKAQLSLAPTTPSGATATPAFEGWYRNADGTYSLSFGYFNRNARKCSRFPLVRTTSISPGTGRSGTADVLLSAPPLGRVRGESAGRLQGQETRLDAQGARTDVRDPRQPPRRVADRRARGRSRIEQHAAGADVRRRRTGSARARRHHRRAHGVGRQAAHARRHREG